jgi:hypothetical protein
METPLPLLPAIACLSGFAATGGRKDVKRDECDQCQRQFKHFDLLSPLCAVLCAVFTMRLVYQGLRRYG